MALIRTPDVYGYTIFCDDIRNEIGGKSSFIGTYMGVMLVHVGFPATLSTFAMAITILQRRRVLNPNLSLWVFLPGDTDNQPSIQGKLHEVTEGKIAQTTAESADALLATKSQPDDDEYVVTNAQMKFAQIVLKEAGIIKVRAIIGDDMFPLGALRVSPPPFATASPTIGMPTLAVS
jgi:hypothetical protein